MNKPNIFTYEIKEADDGKRVDIILATRNEICSRSFAQKLISAGMVSINKNVVNKSRRVLAGEKLSYKVPDPEEIELEPQDIDIKIVYEDKHLAVVEKPAGIVTHPSYGHWDGTMVNALLFHLKDLSTIGGVKRPGIVHRLDKDTSGLLLVAKDDKTHIALSNAIKKKEVQRKYLALVVGTFKENSFSIEAPIGRHPVNRKKMAVVSGAKYAKTNAKVLHRYEKHTLLELSLITGRTHQIRVHLSYINHPIIGDSAYFKADSKMSLGLSRPFLHACEIAFSHPITGKKLNYKSQLPEELSSVLHKLR